MQDTAAVLGQLDLSQTKSKLLAIIANTRGAQIASSMLKSILRISVFDFENFQMRNTHKTIAGP
jgi:hydroxymethylglutaryl-CoA lyase